MTKPKFFLGQPSTHHKVFFIVVNQFTRMFSSSLLNSVMFYVGKKLIRHSGMTATAQKGVAGGRIRKAREALGLTRDELADKLGMTTNNLYLIESGRSDVNLGKLERIANALGLSLGELLPAAGEPIPVVDVEQNIVDMIMLAASAAGEKVAVVVPDDAMSPVYRVRDTVIGTKRPATECHGLDCIVAVGQRLMVRRLYTMSDGLFVLQPYNPAYEIQSGIRAKWAAPIERVERRQRREGRP